MNNCVVERNPSLQTKLSEFASQKRLFALVDPFFEIPFHLPKQHLDIKDTDTELFEMIAWDKVYYQPPQLVEVTHEALDWFSFSLSTERWGIFIVAPVSLAQLGAHLQKFIITKGPEGSPYFLRFHDAAVLETLLEMWTDFEKSMFFGPIESVGLPNLDDLEVKFLSLLNKSDAHRLSIARPEDCLLQLSDAQLLSCRRAIESDLVKLIYWHLRSYHSKVVQFIGKEVLCERIAQGLKRGRSYELATISDLAGFVALMFELAPLFDEHPSFARIFLDPDILPENKMRKLSQVITDREWQEASRLSRKGVWLEFKKKIA